MQGRFVPHALRRRAKPLGQARAEITVRVYTASNARIKRLAHATRFTCESESRRWARHRARF